MIENIPPDCFDSLEEWNEYVQKFWTSLTSDLRPKWDAENFNYCLDCTPAYQYAMLQLGRCAHPETRFFVHTLHEDTELVGIRVLDKIIAQEAASIVMAG